jgi:hypothetical protein
MSATSNADCQLGLRCSHHHHTNTGAMVTVTGASAYDFGGDDIYVGVVNNITACTSNKSTSACGISIYSIDLSVATINLGSSDSITASTNTNEATLPITVTICQTNPTTGVCLQTPGPTAATMINANATPTFGIFVSASGTVPFDPANNRIFVQFTDSTGAVRGETSVAVETM